MQTEAWLNQDHQFPLGQQLFRSDRRFAVWAYTVSHSQLLLRSRTGDGRSRIDIVFKPVEALKVRTEYDGLTIWCARAEERERILAGSALAGRALRILMLETAGGLTGDLDYVVTGAVGWREDDGRDNEPSALASFAPATGPARVLPAHHDAASG